MNAKIDRVINRHGDGAFCNCWEWTTGSGLDLPLCCLALRHLERISVQLRRDSAEGWSAMSMLSGEMALEAAEHAMTELEQLREEVDTEIKRRRRQWEGGQK